MERGSWCSKGREVEFILPKKLEPGYIKVKGGMPGIEKLSLCLTGHAFKLIVADEDPERIILDQLKYLELILTIRDTSHFLYTLGLIRSSPNLQEIKISGLSPFNPEFDYSYPRSYGEVHANCIFNQLQTVTLCHMLHDNPEWELVKYIITRAPSLEVLSFKRYPLAKKDLYLKRLEELMQSPGASPKTKLVFLDPF